MYGKLNKRDYYISKNREDVMYTSSLFFLFNGEYLFI